MSRRGTGPTAGTVLLTLLALLAGACGGDGGGSSSPVAPPPPPGGSERFGAVGCSNTVDSLGGYELVGGTLGWPSGDLPPYGGGAIDHWAEDLGSERWQLFSTELATYGAGRIWLHICITHQREDTVPTAEDIAFAETVVAEINRRSGGLPILASGLGHYSDHVCELTGAGGPFIADGLVDHLVAAGLAERGPVMGPFDLTMVQDDLCHLNRLGRELAGRQLLEFFG